MQILYIEWISKVLLYSTGDHIQYPVINHNGKEYEKEYYIYIYMCVYLNHFVVHQKLTQHCKSTILQFKKTVPGFPGGAVVENLPANAGDMGSSPGLGRSHMPRSN